MKRPLSLIILACLGLFGGYNGFLEALAHYRRGNINDARTEILMVVFVVAVCIGLLRLQRWAWIVSVGYFALSGYVLGVSVWRGIDHPVSFLVIVPPLIVLLSEKVLQAFWGDHLGSGKITASTSSAISPGLTETKLGDMDTAFDNSHTPASTSSAAPPFPVSTQHEATVPMKQSWLRSDSIIALIAAIFSGMQFFFQPFYNHLLKQFFGIGN